MLLKYEKAHNRLVEDRRQKVESECDEKDGCRTVGLGMLTMWIFFFRTVKKRVRKEGEQIELLL